MKRLFDWEASTLDVQGMETMLGILHFIGRERALEARKTYLKEGRPVCISEEGLLLGGRLVISLAFDGGVE